MLNVVVVRRLWSVWSARVLFAHDDALTANGSFASHFRDDELRAPLAAMQPTMDRGRRQRISDPGLAIARAVGQSCFTSACEPNPLLEPPSQSSLSPLAVKDDNRIFGSTMRTDQPSKLAKCAAPAAAA